jgi:quinol monooxygenase YgiN
MAEDVDSSNSKLITLLKLKIMAVNQLKATEIINFVVERVRVEKGCNNFQYCNDITDRDSFLLLQEWESKAVFEKHLHSDEFRHILTLIDLASELPEISFNTISQEEGLEMIASLREQS